MNIVVTTESGSKYVFSEFEGKLHLSYNYRKEVHVTDLSIKGDRLTVTGHDYNIYDQENEDYFSIGPSSRITSIKILEGK